MTAEKAANDNYLKWREKKAGECPIAPELAKIIEKEHAANLHKQTPFFLVWNVRNNSESSQVLVRFLFFGKTIHCNALSEPHIRVNFTFLCAKQRNTNQIAKLPLRAL